MALLILNTKITVDLSNYWNNFNIKICADGAMHRLSTYNQKHNTNYKPDLIIGDMDSYTDLNNDVRIIKIDDQDSTDFTKCVMYLECFDLSKHSDLFPLDNGNKLKDIGITNILVIGGYGGRLDHQCANLQTIIKSKAIITMIDKDNYCTKILKGDNIFTANGSCGLIPLVKSKVKTQGLKWDVDGELEFEGLISTSNYADGKIHVNLEYGSCLFWKEQL